MKKGKRKLVDWEEVNDVHASAVNRRVREDDEELTLSDLRENPDLLPDQDNKGPSTPQRIMGEAVRHLQGRQAEVYLLVMRENKSLAEAAEALGLEKPTVQTYLDRAVKFIRGYCEEAMKLGRV